MGRRSAIAALVTLMGGMLILAGPASAQTGYPPGPCTPTITTANAGNFTVGQTIVVTLAPVCVWTAGANVTVIVNGVTVGTKTVGINGTIQVTIRIVSATQVVIDDPVSVPAVCGLNAIVGSGPSSVVQANVVHTVNFGVVCPVATVQKAGLAFTGANLLRMAAAALVTTLFGALLASTNRKRRQRERLLQRVG